MFDRFSNGLLSLFGLEMDFSIDLHGDRFNSVGTDVFVGSRPTPDDVRPLKEAGITHVVSCLQEARRDQIGFLDKHFKSLFVGLRDGMDQDISATFSDVFRFVDEECRLEDQARVLIHCQAGVSRSATLAIALRMRDDQVDFFEAFSRVRTGRPGVLPNIGFASQLQRFEREVLPQQEQQTGPSSLGRYLVEVCNVPATMETVEPALEHHDYDAAAALREIFGGEIPRVVQGVRF